MKIIDYMVVTDSHRGGCNTGDFAARIMFFIKEGWQPLGPAQTGMVGEEWAETCQTLVKYETRAGTALCQSSFLAVEAVSLLRLAQGHVPASNTITVRRFEDFFSALEQMIPEKKS